VVGGGNGVEGEGKVDAAELAAGTSRPIVALTDRGDDIGFPQRTQLRSRWAMALGSPEPFSSCRLQPYCDVGACGLVCAEGGGLEELEADGVVIADFVGQARECGVDVFLDMSTRDAF